MRRQRIRDGPVAGAVLGRSASHAGFPLSLAWKGRSLFPVNNTALLHLFHEREREWFRLLESAREDHLANAGRQSGHVQWHAQIGIGSHVWLGFYWLRPPFWFGYGLSTNGWLPVVDASGRGCPMDVVIRLRDHLPHIWRDMDFSQKTYWRLWAPTDTPDTADAHLKWLKARGRELHEFLVEE